MTKSALDVAIDAAFAEIQRQFPSSLDCSQNDDSTNVLVFDGLNLRLVVQAVITSLHKAAFEDSFRAMIEEAGK